MLNAFAADGGAFFSLLLPGNREKTADEARHCA